MFRIVLSFLFLVLFVSFVRADRVDSLMNLTKSGPDTIKVKAYLKLASTYRKTNNDSSLYFMEIADTVLQDLKETLDEKRYDFFKAQFYQQKALRFQQGDHYDSASQYYNQALSIFKKLNKQKKRTQVINNLGALQEQQGNYPQALEYYFQSMRLCDSAGLKKGKSRALINIGVIYNNQENYDEALKYYEQAIPIKRELGDSKGEALLYNNIGIVYYYQDNFEKVLEYFKRSLNIYREIGDLRSQSMPYYNIAEIYLEQKAYKEALYYYKKSYEIDKTLGERASQAETLGTIGAVYAQLGQMEDALRVQHEAVRLLKEVGAKNRYAEALRKLAYTYEQRNDYRNALKYFKQYKLMQDSVHTLKKESQIAKIKEEYETEKKDQKIDLLQERNKRIQLENLTQKEEMKNRQRISILSLLIAILGLVALVMIYRMYRQKKLSSNMLEIKNQSITEKNKEISAIVTQLESALQSREILYSNTTHELRTPLNIINGFTNLLQTECDPERRMFYVGQVKSSANHLLRLIEDMLVISRLETGKFELVYEGVKIADLTKYLENIFSVLAITKQIKFSCQVNENCPEILTIDPVRYFQIISNLLDNAIKYTDIGGEVTITFDYEKQRFLRATIKDSGIGIAEEKQKEIFDRYRRIKDSELTQTDGTGLGLNIVQQLVELFEGQVEVNSKFGEGSAFSVIIPSEVAFHVTYRYAIVYDDVLSEKMGQGRILIAEDNIASAELIKQTLTVYNPELTLDFVYNGEDAVLQVKKNKYDLLIVDIKMPLMSGIEVVQAIRSLQANQNKDLPVIGISAQSDDKTRKDAQNAGVNEFIPKPYEPGVLILKIEEIAALQKRRTKRIEQKKAEDESNAIGNILNQIDEQLRNHSFTEAVELINAIQNKSSGYVSDNLRNMLAQLEKELVTTQSNDKIGKLIIKIIDYWKSNFG